jgi:vacuolar-type H+-ATPase subunit E/Vma4
MGTQEQRLNVFLDCINESARKAVENIMSEADEYEEKELEKAKQEAAQKGWEYIKYESEKLKSLSNRRISEANISMKKQIMEQRNQIADSVFGKVSEKLTAFTQTDEYKDFLLKSVHKTAAFYEGKAFTVMLKESDLKYRDFLIKSVDNLSSVEPDKSIHIGGCRAKSEGSNAELDDTLDSRLESEKSWFYENSQLTL